VRPSRWRRAFDSPPLSGIGLLWPGSAPWRIRSASGRPEAVPTGSSPFTLVSSNALGKNPTATAFAEALTALDADVVVVVEASDGVLAALDAAGIDHRLGPGIVEHRPPEGRIVEWGGCGVWSRYPTERIEAGDVCTMGHAYLAVRVHLPDGPVDVVAAHTYAPFKRGSRPLWLESFERLAAVVERLDGPVVAAGDWNATLGHHPMRAFLARTGLRDAHTATGRGRARSWPVARWSPPLGLIDHVLVGPRIAVAAVEERTLPGSDHEAILARLALRPPSPAPTAPG
jgi:endonuclease/exonuclease/phosphatase family metal-dependent hydrolase